MQPPPFFSFFLCGALFDFAKARKDQPQCFVIRHGIELTDKQHIVRRRRVRIRQITDLQHRVTVSSEFDPISSSMSNTYHFKHNSTTLGFLLAQQPFLLLDRQPACIFQHFIIFQSVLLCGS
jgi:hypothetical protein